jgi:hypothetical protein
MNKKISIVAKAWLNKTTFHKFLVIFALIIIIVLFVVAIFFSSTSKQTRSETYKNTTGDAAGLKAAISYDDTSCDKQPCKPAFDFNVYIFNNNGQQISVVRPDKDGNVSAALPEGKYIMLIGKFDKNNLFPEEPLVLKKGQELELKLHYKEGAL